MAAPLTSVYAAGMANVRTAVADAAGMAWDDLDDYREPEDFTSRIVPVVLAGQSTAASFTDAYIARAIGRPPVGVPLAELEEWLRGVPLGDVYERPYHDVWYGLSQGKPLAEAASTGRARAVMLAATEVALGMRAADRFLGRNLDEVEKFTRVSSGGCELCDASDGEEYSDGGDMPLHPNCGCTLEPVIAGSSTFAGPEEGPPPESEREDTVAVHDHGELGPMLGNAEDDFREEVA